MTRSNSQFKKLACLWESEKKKKKKRSNALGDGNGAASYDGDYHDPANNYSAPTAYGAITSLPKWPAATLQASEQPGGHLMARGLEEVYTEKSGAWLLRCPRPSTA